MCDNVGECDNVILCENVLWQEAGYSLSGKRRVAIC